MSGRWWLLAAAVVALYVLAAHVGPAAATVSAALALPFVFFLPGYAVISAAFADRYKGFELIVLSCGLSTAITVLCGFVLHWLGAMTPTGWAAILGSITLVAAAAAGRAFAPVFPQGFAWPHPLSRNQMVMPALSALIALSAIGIARNGALSHREFAYTEFWLLPSETGNRLEYTLGFANSEAATTAYDVEVLVDGRTLERWSGIELGAGESWETDVALPRGFHGGQRAEARLYKNGDYGVVYRQVWAETPAVLSNKGAMIQ
jgi:uncharacterized membrane protein